MTEDEIRLLSDIFGGKETKVPSSITEVPVIGGLSSTQQKMRDILRDRAQEEEKARQAELAARPLSEKAKGVAESGRFIGSTVGRSVGYPFAELYGRATGQPELGKEFLKGAKLPESDLGLEYTVRFGEALEPVAKAMETAKLPHVPFLPELLPLYTLPTFVSQASVAKGAQDVAKGAKDVAQAAKAEFQTAPVGAVQLQAPTVPVSELNFYSPAQQAVVNLKQQKGTGNQFLAQISKTPGVKPAELEWTGLADFLRSRGEQPVTKQEINNYLRNNKVQVSEKIMVSPKARNKMINDALPFNYSLLPDGTYHDYISDTYFYQHELPDEIRDDIRMITDNFSEAEYDYGEYVLPGGENYREILLTIPVKEKVVETQIPAGPKPKIFENKISGDFELLDAFGEPAFVFKTRAEAEKKAEEIAAPSVKKEIVRDQEFRSSHYLEPNVISHMRVNDRVDADGNKVLFVEEIQSDWGQQRRKNLRMAEDSGSEMVREGAESNTPNAPFVNSTEDWVNLSLKRLITEAVNKGYDRVAFINGTQSADRYDLSKQVDSIRLEFADDGTRTVAVDGHRGNLIFMDVDNSGKVTFADSQPELKNKKLEDVIGKEMAEKIMSSKQDKVFSGVDLEVGGEGMKKFYDQIVPNIANKLLKKLGGGKLEEINISVGKKMFDMYDLEDATPEELAKLQAGGGFKQLGFTITPEMRSLVKQGLPLFAKGGRVLSAVEQAGKAAKKASDAKRREQRVQANLEAYMGGKDKPKTYYHATQANEDFEVFDLEKRPTPKSAKAVFLTPSTDWASTWLDTDMSMLEKTGVPKPRVMPLITRAKNTFDYENPGHVTQLMNQVELPLAINRQHVADMISEGNWNFIEDQRIQQAIRDLGFDSFNVSEKGTKNLGVFDIHDVKALFNRGSYDPNEPSISKAKGGLACL